MPATWSRRPGTTYFTTAPAATSAVATAKTIQAVAPPSAHAQTRTPPRTSTEPGRIGTRMPTRPTAISRATRTSVAVTGSTLSQRIGGTTQMHRGPGLASGAAVEVVGGQ